MKKIEKNINYINSVYYKKEYNINIKNELIKNIENINKELNRNITVYDVKKIQTWIFSEKEKPKVIYINEIENLSFNVHNSLLKILEEPPSNIYFILAARNKNKIPKTILSRLRIYNFTKPEKRLGIQIFKESFLTNKDITIEEYFASFYEEESKKIKKELIKILNIIKEKKFIFNLEEIDFIKDDQSFKIFLNELTINIRKDFLENKIDINQYLKYTEHLKNIYKYRPYNQNKKLIIENLMLNYEEIWIIFFKKALTKLNKLSNEQKTKFIEQIYKKIEIYDGIFASINEGIIVLDKQNNIIYSNKILYQILALTAKSKIEILDDIQIPILINLIKELVRTEDKIIGLEVPISNNIYIKISFMPYVKEKKLEGNIILIEDIKEKKRKRKCLEELRL